MNKRTPSSSFSRQRYYISGCTILIPLTISWMELWNKNSRRHLRKKSIELTRGIFIYSHTVSLMERNADDG